MNLTNPIVIEAVQEYLGRQNGSRKPKAIMEIRGSKGKFVVDPDEKQKCCHSVSDSMLYMHCFSMEHVATMYGIPTNTLKRAVRLWSEMEKA
jgi:L-lysine 2,3-aminomutase